METEVKRLAQTAVTPADASPVAYRRHRTCDRKKVYASLPEGWAAVRHIQRNGNDPYPDFELRPYTCAFCQQIHVGHSNTPKASEDRLRAETQALRPISAPP